MIEQTFREEWGRVLASLIGFFGDFDVAEEAAQEAFAIAAERWPRKGVPPNPGGWLVTTARNKALDRLRRERTFAVKARLLQEPQVLDPFASDFDESAIPDERLELIFTCCHPALATEAQVALTLRTLGGLSTDALAAAFLVTPETMKRRLTRAKAKIKGAGIPFSVPPDHALPERVAAVLAALYLIFNAGYSGPVDLSEEALRLARVLVELMPDEPEASGLLALMLCHHARRASRFSGGDLVLLADQDRSLFDPAQLREGRAVLDVALARGGRGSYVLQAAIASLQADQPIDWPQVAALYLELSRLTRSPVVELNRAVAVAEAGSPSDALAIVSTLGLDDYPYLHSTRAELLRRLSRHDEARAAYERALDLSRTEPERRFLRKRLAALADLAGGK